MITSEFPKNTNPSALRAGLVYQGDAEITGSELGLEETTLNFLCLHENYRKFRPKRGTPCDQFMAGDDDTKVALRILNYLAAQSRTFTENAQGPGIGLLAILCRGALFDNPDADDPITTVFDTIGTTLDNVSFSTYKKNADSGFYDTRYDVELDYDSIDLNFQYVAKNKSALPRFVKEGDYLIDEDHPLNSAPKVERTSAIIRLADLGTIGTPADIIPAEYLPWIKYQIVQSQFSQVPAGACWNVTETGTVKIIPIVPGPITAPPTSA